MAKEVRVSVRVTPELKARLQKAEEVTGLPETQVVIRSLEAYCEYVEKNGEFTSPFAILPAKIAQQLGAHDANQDASTPFTSHSEFTLQKLNEKLGNREEDRFSVDLVAEEQAEYGKEARQQHIAANNVPDPGKVG